jgi:hypothetical protein
MYRTRSRSADAGTGSASNVSIVARKAARVLPDPVGAWMRVCAPEAIAGHPRLWASVGSGNDVSNQALVAGEKRSRGSEVDTHPTVSGGSDVYRGGVRT